MGIKVNNSQKPVSNLPVKKHVANNLGNPSPVASIFEIDCKLRQDELPDVSVTPILLDFTTPTRMITQ